MEMTQTTAAATETEQLTPEELAAQKKEQMAVIDYKMVTFSLAGKDYAIDIMKVKEIAKAGRFTYVPNTLPFVLGVYNLRGEIIPIVDLRLFFNIDIPERKNDSLENMLIVSVGEQTFGVVVDAIDKVVGIQKSTIQPPHPLFGDINIKYIFGVVESNNRLYILLDIDRIFGTRISAEDKNAQMKQLALKQTARVVAESGKMPETGKKADPKASAAVPENKVDVDYSFVVDSLNQFRKFNVNNLNEMWVKHRYDEWKKERGPQKTQLQNIDDADAFLKPFYSKCNGTWWTQEYADAIYKVLPDNAAKQITVWNPGCGKGYESYSLACLLKKRYPDSRIRIYAHDVDLLCVSNAPLMTVPADVANGWYAPNMTKTASGEYTFNKDIKDIVMFEYHDCVNTNALPVVDLVFARDVLSFLPTSAQNTIFEDFEDKLKGNGIIILGDNETLAGNKNWGAKTVGSVEVYSKQ